MRRGFPAPVCAADRSPVRTAPAPRAVNKLRKLRREASGRLDCGSPLSLSKLFAFIARHYDEGRALVSRVHSPGVHELTRIWAEAEVRCRGRSLAAPRQ